jgi:hypothetical protein
MFTIDNVPVCFYLDETMTQEVTVNGKSERHYFPAIVTAFEPLYSQTNWDYGSDFKLAAKTVDKLNTERGVNAKAASLIVATSMFPGNRISLDEIYAANGEAVPITVR